MKIKRARQKPQRCTSDLSRNPETVAGMGPLLCEVEGEPGHEIHQRWSAPMAARWRDFQIDGRTGREVFEMGSL